MCYSRHLACVLRRSLRCSSATSCGIKLLHAINGSPRPVAASGSSLRQVAHSVEREEERLTRWRVERVPASTSKQAYVKLPFERNLHCGQVWILRRVLRNQATRARARRPVGGRRYGWFILYKLCCNYSTLPTTLANTPLALSSALRTTLALELL